MANEVLGQIRCLDCGGVANVMQSLRRGVHLYARCPDCGIDQKTGVKPQTRWYYRTQWNGEPPPMPSNVQAGGEFMPDLPGEPEPKPEIEPDDFELSDDGGFDVEVGVNAGSSKLRMLGFGMISAVSLAVMWRFI